MRYGTHLNTILGKAGFLRIISETVGTGYFHKSLCFREDQTEFHGFREDEIQDFCYDDFTFHDLKTPLKVFEVFSVQ